jgi:hypothetical protein
MGTGIVTLQIKGVNARHKLGGMTLRTKGIFFLIQKRRAPVPTTPRQIDPERAKAAEKKNKWDRLAPPSDSPSGLPDVPDATVAGAMATSEKLLEEVAVGTSKSSKSEIQELTGGEEGDIAAKAEGEGNEPRQREEKKGVESQALCTSQR